MFLKISQNSQENAYAKVSFLHPVSRSFSKVLMLELSMNTYSIGVLLQNRKKDRNTIFLKKGIYAEAATGVVL